MEYTYLIMKRKLMTKAMFPTKDYWIFLMT